MDNNKLPKQERLSGRKRIGTLFSEGSTGFVYPFRYVFALSDGGSGEGKVSILVSVPKKYHKRAVRRNKLRRRTRESYRLGKRRLSD